MALIVADRVKEATSTTGTGNVTLGGPAVGYQAFSTIGNGNVTYYCIAGQGTADWEVGVGTYVSPSTFIRNVIFSSSNSGAIVNFPAGLKDIFCTLPSERAVYNNADGSLVYDPAGSAILYAIALG